MHLITKKHLSRRHVLRAGGATVALPFLECMVPAGTALAQTAAAPKQRFGFFYFAHGQIMDRWVPTTAGRDFEMPENLKGMEKYRDKMTIVSGMHNRPADSPNPHGIVPGTWLSCVHPAQSQSPNMSTTVDQIIAAKLGQTTSFPSLEVSTEQSTSSSGACDRNFGCSYANTISFRTPTQPLPMENDGRKLFYRMFGQGDTPEMRALANKQYASLLDLVHTEANELMGTMGRSDKNQMDNYLQSIREIERQVEVQASKDMSAVQLPDVPPGPLPDFPGQLNLMFNMLALAYQADLTRVVNMVMVKEGSSQTYGNVGVPDAFHALSHHQNDPQKINRLAQIQKFHTAAFTAFLDKLAAMNEGENSVLDNAMLLYGSNMSNSNKHDHYPLPALVVGGGAGKLKGGQHIKTEDHTPLANLHLTLLDRAGIHQESFGDSTGTFSEM